MLHLVWLCLTYLCVVDSAISVRKFVYQKDLSEYCRRQVIPSVFLGRRVVETQSQILHFSQLEVPYTCFVTIRAEVGSNVIMVVQMAADENLPVTCQINPDQLQVFELGETFGGYWGPIPERMVKPRPPTVNNKYYTLKTTTTSTTITTDDSERTRTTSKTTPKIKPTRLSYEDNTAGEIVPIVKMSINLVPGQLNISDGLYDMNEVFDMNYDVTPITNEKYTESDFPIAKLMAKPAIKKLGQKNNQRKPEGSSAEPRFNLEFLLDNRMPGGGLLPMYKNLFKPHKPNVNKLLKFRKKIVDTFHTKKIPGISKIYDKVTPSLNKNTSDEVSEEDAWAYIDYFVRKLQLQSNATEDSLGAGAGGAAGLDHSAYKDLSAFLETISNLPVNSSAYLVNSSLNTNQSDGNQSVKFNTSSTAQSFETVIDIISGYLHDMSTIPEHSATPKQNFFINEEPEKGRYAIKNHEDPLSKMPQYSFPTKKQTLSLKHEKSSTTRRGTKVTKVTKENQNKYQATIALQTAKKTKKSPPKEYGSSFTTTKMPQLMPVDRESWENLVQAAPVIVQSLNKTLNNSSNDTQKISQGQSHIGSRSKRFIQAVIIEDQGQQAMTTRFRRTGTPYAPYYFRDMQDFADLLELEDDELYGHLSLKYLNNFIGAQLFNICAFKERDSKTKHVFLLNSSRSVIALNKFTMRHLTVVATPAITLQTPEARCQPDYIECQVSGARVCIDAMTACDGVPNCGAYDIYDEDRLRCGVNKNQYNIYLAAFTVLAAFLTLLYIVHYWLKRCVPKVSDAFFVYTEGSENMLYLETIMRSPYDFGATKQGYGQFHMGDARDIGATFYQKKLKKTRVGKIITKISKCFAGKTFRHSSHENKLKRTYSYTELELSKYGPQRNLDVGVQTGSSLELGPLLFPHHREQSIDAGRKNINIRDSEDFNESVLNVQYPSFTDDGSRHRSLDSELNVLKFFRDNAAKHGHPHIKKTHSTEEKEIQCTELDSPSSIAVSVYGESSSSAAMLTRSTEKTEPEMKKHLRFLDHPAIPDEIEELEPIEEDQEQATTTKDFSRFWNPSKLKMHRKKKF